MDNDRLEATVTPEDKTYCDSVNVLGSHPAKYNTLDIVNRICAQNIPGDFAEAGVAGGGHIAVMDYGLRKNRTLRQIHAFDSWEGICKGTEEDPQSAKDAYGIRKPGEPIESSGELTSSVENFRSNMNKWGARNKFIFAHKGWFQNILPSFQKLGLKLSLLRIDVDLVDSVRACAQYLYPMLVKGGYCIFDDWYTSWSPQRGAMLDHLHANSIEGKVAWSEFTEVEGNPGTVWWRKA